MASKRERAQSHAAILAAVKAERRRLERTWEIQRVSARQCGLVAVLVDGSRRATDRIDEAAAFSHYSDRRTAPTTVTA